MSNWPFPPPIAPMEARVAEELPPQQGWAFEPKWDGFRAVGWSGQVRLDSRNGRPLLRYFPELTPALETLPAGTVVDGEVVVIRGDRLDFDSLQMRLHPAASRVARLANETPASLIAFDLLADRGEDLRGSPYDERRSRLTSLAGGLSEPWRLTPATVDRQKALRWFVEFEAAGCDGVVAKRRSGPYLEGKRDMVKVKHRRSIDCVIGGYRVEKDGSGVGSILLGLFDQEGRLNFVGHCSGFSAAERAGLLAHLAEMRSGESFAEEVRHPGEESRWSSGKDLSWMAVAPVLVAEVSYDQKTGDRIRHATRFLRWRPDKDARECTLDQLQRPSGPGFSSLLASS